ncbi:hypothetical protein DFQ28_008875 [Apophysomyces sp. BC1034]|nr:hypothetical protein DFQ30_005239 [Apophysomyces sp. BC1015]KAG0183386.1 hypothetical protein DFQ29_005762 [Apophysomyces sp. BC1021]KAG0194616.1 hypothetical protein DFQ28_008875 [Apophysomyces sp. BC1034]
MNCVKKTYDELKAFYSVRASLHEEFGKKLLRHVKTELGREETGTLHMLLVSAHKELEITALANLELAQKIRMNLELSLDNFILEQKDKRKLIQTNVDKAHRNKKLHATYVSKAKEKYETECAKQLTLENQFSGAGTREAERLRQKIDRTQQEIKTLDQEYKNACFKLAEATAVWNNGWKYACDKYQNMEQKRAEFIHHSLSVYVNILSTASGQDQESYERFWKSLDQCDPEKDIETFINEKGTGPMIPEPPEYVHYLDDPAKTLPKYQVAQFSDTNVVEAAVTTAKPWKEPKVRRISTKRLPQEKNLPKTPERQPSLAYKTPTMTSDKKITKQPSRRQPMMYPSTSYGTHSQHTGFSGQQETVAVDESIDPRAQVVFSIGSNLFQVSPEEPKPKRSTSIRKNNVEKACDISIRDLLDQLNVEPSERGSNAKTALNSKASALHRTSVRQPKLNTRSTDDILAWGNGLWWAHKWDENTSGLVDPGGYVDSAYLEVFRWQYGTPYLGTDLSKSDPCLGPSIK